MAVNGAWEVISFRSFTTRFSQLARFVQLQRPFKLVRITGLLLRFRQITISCTVQKRGQHHINATDYSSDITHTYTCWLSQIYCHGSPRTGIALEFSCIKMTVKVKFDPSARLEPTGVRADFETLGHVWTEMLLYCIRCSKYCVLASIKINTNKKSTN